VVHALFAYPRDISHTETVFSAPGAQIHATKINGDCFGEH
jgi:hypothetical protein